ncbi:MAG: dialkylresorcinol condensing enzyme [Phycisphaerae bacterium]|nr:dialkylresorcinol condensing enzyme [Gemmatimonadaceae bacterium]
MKSVLLIQYSQSGQLTDVARAVTAPLVESAEIELTVETLRPKTPFPFPWPVLQFFDTFPSAVYLDGCELEPLKVDPNRKFDLVILSYQVWFLSPSLPVTGFLKSADAKLLLHDTPVMTLIACRDMWLMAQEQVKLMLDRCGARLVGNVALVDEAGTAGSFFATPAWVLSGNKGPHLFGVIPRAGVKPEQITASRRFGERIAHTLGHDLPVDGHLLQGLGAVRINEKLIASEKTARRSFLIWGSLFRKLGPTGAFARKPVLILYVLFLFTLIVTFIPISMLIKKLLAPFAKARVASQKAYFAYPSGE